MAKRKSSTPKPADQPAPADTPEKDGQAAAENDPQPEPESPEPTPEPDKKPARKPAEKQASPPADESPETVPEFADVCEVRLSRDHMVNGEMQNEGHLLAVVYLTPGVPLNFLVDAVRSDLTRTRSNVD